VTLWRREKDDDTRDVAREVIEIRTALSEHAATVREKSRHLEKAAAELVADNDDRRRKPRGV